MRTTAEENASKHRREKNELRERQANILRRIEGGTPTIKRADLDVLEPLDRLKISRSNVKIK